MNFDKKWYGTMIESEAAAMAESVNGGKWSEYTDNHKRGWMLKIAHVIDRYAICMGDAEIIHGNRFKDYPKGFLNG